METILRFDEELSQRLALPIDSPTYTDSNNNSDSDKSSSRGDKYSLRPRSMRRRNNNNNNNIEHEPDPVISNNNKNSNSRQSKGKPKQKAAPLSKYRRKTANARERSRMREINQAFEALRKAVPQMSAHCSGTNEKLTKITTLRLAMKYISTLSAVLTTGQQDNNNSHDLLSDCSELDCLLLESDGESLPLQSDLSDHSLTPVGDFTVDFPDDSSLTPVDFSPLSPLSDHLTPFDTFLNEFS